MNIGFFTDTYTPLVDGVVRSILEFREGLEARGHTVYVFCPSPTKEGKQMYGLPDPPDDDRVFRLSAIDSVFLPGYPFAIPISYKATRTIPKLKLDVVHCHTPVTVGLLGDLVAFLANLPKVFTYHTYYAEYSRSYILGGQEITPKMVEEYERLYMNRSDTVITPSEKLAELLRGEYRFQGELEVIPTGIDLEEFSEISPEPFLEQLKRLRKKRILLFAGRLGKEKNIPLLLEAMRALSDVPDLVLVIAGTGRYEQKLRERAGDLIHRDRVVFTGVLDRHMMLSAFSAAELFLFPSATDTQGLVLSEAVATGTPVVMVDTPSVSPACVPNETTVHVSNDAEEFAQAVRRLLEDKEEYARMASSTLAHASNLSMDRSIDALIATYKHVIEEHQSASWRTRARTALSKEVHLPQAFPGIRKGKVNMKKVLKGMKDLLS